MVYLKIIVKLKDIQICSFHYAVFPMKWVQNLN